MMNDQDRESLVYGFILAALRPHGPQSSGWSWLSLDSYLPYELRDQYRQFWPDHKRYGPRLP